VVAPVGVHCDFVKGLFFIGEEHNFFSEHGGFAARNPAHKFIFCRDGLTDKNNNMFF
jgi:hypothetical protein